MTQLLAQASISKPSNLLAKLLVLTAIIGAVSCGPAADENSNVSPNPAPIAGYPSSDSAGPEAYPGNSASSQDGSSGAGLETASAYPAPDRNNAGANDVPRNIAAGLRELEGKLLYQSDQSGSFQIYLQEDDAEPLSLTSDLPMAVEGNWSPDGEKIAFVTQGSDASNLTIQLMDADGSGKRPLMPDQPRLNWRPTWSPDGHQLLFMTNRDGNFEIYRANLDGSDLVNLTNDPANDLDPDWSSVTNKIVFVSNRQGDNGIYTMNPDGSGLTKLLGEEDQLFYPRWSPDGQLIAFVSSRSGSGEIHLMSADGSDVRQVTDRVGENTMPSWVNNDRLLFSGDFGDETWDLYIIDIDGTNMIQLTEQELAHTFSERYPVWRP